MTEAKYYKTIENNKVQCQLCPHNCIIASGKYGFCKVRKNIDGKLSAETFGKLCALHLDPIEKKPLYHFHPNTKIFSLGSIGCNLRCYFCQNHEISQCGLEQFGFVKTYTPQEIVHHAKHLEKNIGLAFTYNEPTVWFEFMKETAHLAKKEGLKNVMVTNGFINPEPLDELLECIDAFNVDLKGFSECFYKEKTHSLLEPVKENLKRIKKAGKHFEITNLVITNDNDEQKDFQNMVCWIAKELGNETILHISRYFPRYKSTQPATPEKTLKEFYFFAKQKLTNVYLGNI